MTAVAVRAPAAKFATRRTPGLPTLGPRLAVVSARLGAPLMPWQHQVANTALQLHPWLPGAFRYRLVIVTVPRQAGKTTLMRAIAVDRAITTPDAGVWMTAQTGQQARRRWGDLTAVVTGRTSPLRGHVKPYLSAGSEQLRIPNGSFISPFAPVPKALHGETPPLVMLDESWAYDEAQGAALMDAIRPAQITLPNRQLWVLSTRGTTSSVWFNELLQRGVDSLADPESDVAYFDWSADEELAQADPTSPDTLAFHPALGFTQRLEDLQAEAALNSPAAFRRGFLNLTTANTEGACVDLALFDSLAEDDTPQLPQSGLVYAYSVAEGRTGASIWAAEALPGERVRLRFVETSSGAAWLAPRLAELSRQGATLVADDAGATRSVTNSPAMRAVNVTPVGVRDYATACTTLLGHVNDRTLVHDGAPELRDALEAAELRPMGGGKGFDERYSRGPIDAAKAAALAAYHAAQHQGRQLF